MKTDITNRKDLHLIVTEFYKKLLVNKEIKHFFGKFQDNSILEGHLNTLVDFWDNILFFSGTYNKNAMQPHILLHQKAPFKKIHFETWLNLFNQSVGDHFKGEKAEVLKNRALSVATIMRIKTINS